MIQVEQTVLVNLPPGSLIFCLFAAMARLVIRVNRFWFEQIASGAKTEDYRAIKPFWTARLEGRHYDSVLITNGYGLDRPRLIADYRGHSVIFAHGTLLYAIHLGTIRSITNY